MKRPSIMLFGITLAAIVLPLLLRPAPSHDGVVDSLQTVAREAVQRVEILQADNAALLVKRDDLERERDALKAASARATQRIMSARPALPENPADNTLRSDYRTALALLDTAIAALAQAHAVIRADSLAAIQSKRIEANLNAQIAELTTALESEMKAGERETVRANKAERRASRAEKAVGVVAVASAIIGAWLRGQ